MFLEFRKLVISINMDHPVKDSCDLSQKVYEWYLRPKKCYLRIPITYLFYFYAFFTNGFDRITQRIKEIDKTCDIVIFGFLT
jgi:hypothetical protein